MSRFPGVYYRSRMSRAGYCRYWRNATSRAEGIPLTRFGKASPGPASHISRLLQRTPIRKVSCANRWKILPFSSSVLRNLKTYAERARIAGRTSLPDRSRANWTRRGQGNLFNFPNESQNINCNGSNDSRHPVQPCSPVNICIFCLYV